MGAAGTKLAWATLKACFGNPESLLWQPRKPALRTLKACFGKPHAKKSENKWQGVAFVKIIGSFKTRIGANFYQIICRN